MGLHRPVVPFVAGVIGNVVNFAVAYVLIFGYLGLPRLGLIGAGLGSVIGTVVQVAVIGWFFLFGPTSREFHVRRQCRVSWPAIGELVRLGMPAGLMFLGDLLLWTIFMGYIMGRFGTPALAATNILGRYWQLCFMPALGVSTAATAIVGRYCGAGQPRLAGAGPMPPSSWSRSTWSRWAWPCGWPADYLVGLFNESGDPAIQALATQHVHLHPPLPGVRCPERHLCRAPCAGPATRSGPASPNWSWPTAWASADRWPSSTTPPSGARTAPGPWPRSTSRSWASSCG